MLIYAEWPATCDDLDDAGYNSLVGSPGTLVQMIELFNDGSVVAAADTKRIASGACGAI
jgi:hypothetical protein